MHGALALGPTTTTARNKNPKRLSGGNPKIEKGDGDEPVRAYIDAMPGWKREVGRALDALVKQCVPKAKKAVRWNTPFYGIEGQGWFLAYHCFTKYVKVTFFRGAELNPKPPVMSKDPNVRYVHIHQVNELDERLLKRWIKQAAKLPGEHVF